MKAPGVLFLMFCFASTLWGSENSSTQIDYYTPQNLRKFADYLYNQGDYLHAAGEYQRYAFIAPQDADAILPRIAASYRLGGRVDQAIRYLSTILQQRPISDQARYELGASYFWIQDYDESHHVLEESQGLFEDENYIAKSQLLMGLNYLMQKRWDMASQHLNELQTSTMAPEFRESARLHRQYAEDGKRLSSKSPLLAGVLSTFLPGTGRLYVGRPNDAILTVFLLGLMGWQAYDGFSENGRSSRKSWTLGTLGGIFYLGNIYGSAVAAQVYNRRTGAAFLATIPFQIP